MKKECPLAPIVIGRLLVIRHLPVFSRAIVHLLCHVSPIEVVGPLFKFDFEEKEHRLSHLAGHRKVTVNGETISERVLQDGDTIEIAGRCFVFRAPV